MIYGQTVFPLAGPVEIRQGDTISLDFSASLVGGDYVFAWETRVREPHGALKVEFAQSTLSALTLSPTLLHGLRETAAPSLTRDGEAVAFVLARVDGRRTLGDLAREVEAQFPERFRRNGDALRFVTEVAQTHCH